MNRPVAAHPGSENHVIRDKLDTFKPKRDRWRARHTNVHFHFTPTHASWLSQVECRFSNLAHQSHYCASFNPVTELRGHIDAVANDNQSVPSFAWTKSEVHHGRLEPRFADMRLWVLGGACRRGNGGEGADSGSRCDAGRARPATADQEPPRRCRIPSIPAWAPPTGRCSSSSRCSGAARSSPTGWRSMTCRR